jgi:hypothetical protein
MDREIEIPTKFKEIRPDLKENQARGSDDYIANVLRIINWAEEVDNHFFDLEFDALLASASHEQEQKEAIDYLLQKYSFHPDLEHIFEKCRRFRPDLNINELKDFLKISDSKRRGRPQGVTQEVLNKNLAVEHYKRLRDIIYAEYKIYSKDLLIEYVSKFWGVKAEELDKQISRSNERTRVKR